MGEDTTLRIAVQSKGRLHDDTMRLFAAMGIEANTNKRILVANALPFPAELLFLRDDDIPQCVALGVADIGVVGENEYCERGSNATVLRRLGFSRCRLSLAVPSSADYEDLSWFNGKTVATSYPQTLARFFAERGVRAAIHVITGSVEVSPGIGLADAVFDIVSSGSTLQQHGLREVAVVQQSEALLIANARRAQEKEALVAALLFRLEAVLNARDKKYILMNVPHTRLDAVLAVLHGAKSPTVMPLAIEGWSSVHTVVEEQQLWSIISELKERGAQGILVLPIEKMVY